MYISNQRPQLATPLPGYTDIWPKKPDIYILFNQL